MQIGDFSVPNWERIGRIEPDALVPVREELHRAAQFPAAIGRSLADSQAQYVHTTLEFWGSVGTLVSRESASTGVRLGLAPAEGRLIFFGPGRGIVGALELADRTVEGVWRWIEEILEETGTPPEVFDRRHPEYELPDHRLDEGGAFQLRHMSATAEMARHFANAHRLLSTVFRSERGTAPVRTWPGPFATVRTTEHDPEKRLGKGQSMTYGFSAGSEPVPEPYWYVRPRPAPAPDEVADLPGPGHWHRGEWVGTVLPVSRIAAVDDQPAAVVEFLRASRSVGTTGGEQKARKGAE